MKETITLTNNKSDTLPRTYVRYTADKQPGSFYEQAMATSWQRAQDEGWKLYEVDTVHSLTDDSEHKAMNLLKLIDEQGL